MTSTLSGIVLLVLSTAVFNNYRRGTLGQWFQAKFLGRADPANGRGLVTGSFGAPGAAPGTTGELTVSDQALAGMADLKTAGRLETWRGATLDAAAMASYKVMVLAAQADGVTLVAGSTYRSNAAQFALRGTNGCRGREYDRSCKGTPITAIPGSSQHEQGLAVDFRNMSTRSGPGYAWLKANAGRFGWKNFDPEPWHWSTGPKAGS